jgi:hypothetical protein
MAVFHAPSFSRDVPIQESTTSLMAPFNGSTGSTGSTQKEFEPQREKQVACLVCLVCLACLTCLNPKEVTPLVTQYTLSLSLSDHLV